MVQSFLKTVDRKTLLMVAAGAVLGLALLDYVVIEPAFQSWHEQGDRIDALSAKVDRGEKLLARETQTRARWAQMQRANLPADNAAAENIAYRAIGRWEADSGITPTSFNPQWQEHDEGYDTYECRVAAVGNQASLAKFIYDLEVDPAPVSLEECEISTRDTHGSQLTMTARFSFIRLGQTTP